MLRCFGYVERMDEIEKTLGKGIHELVLDNNGWKSKCSDLNL
jgi:hypothetical protein